MIVDKTVHDPKIVDVLKFSISLVSPLLFLGEKCEPPDWAHTQYSL